MEFKLFDSHCHPQFPQYDADRDEVIERALSQGIGMLCVGTDLAMSKAAIALAERYDGLYASVGLHPNDALEQTYDERPFRELLDNPNVVAVGEIGLDFYRTTDEDHKRAQRERFESQLNMAVSIDLPVVIHCRDAHSEMREVLGSFVGKNLTGVVHSFTGTWADAKHYAEMGFYIGLNGIITFARDYDETVRNLPLEQILLETDAPFLTPKPYRGKRNEPSYVTEVAKVLSEIRGAGISSVRKVTTANTLDMFIK